jgi:hypothetical protein
MYNRILAQAMPTNCHQVAAIAPYRAISLNPLG